MALKAARISARNKAPLGQNFLSDSAAALQLVDSLGDISKKLVVEIGPGKGALTQMLSKRAGRLIAIELDRKLTAQLRMEYSRHPKVEIIEADVLSIDFDTIVQGDLHGITDRQDKEPIKATLIGNLPYYITSEILLRLFAFHRNFDQIVIMVQKEVGERIAAIPGTRDYGLLSATAQLYADVEHIFTLPPTAFLPPPKVHSSVLRLRVSPKARALGVDADRFLSFLKLTFAQKRKTLANNLKTTYDIAKVKTALKETGLRLDVRAEAVTLEKMATFYKQITAASP